MNNIESFLPSIEKLLDNLLLESIEGEYEVSLVKYPHYSKYLLQIDVNVNVAKTVELHKEYDSNYSDTMWNLDNILKNIYKYLGLSYENLVINVSTDYYNYDFLEDEIFNLREKIIFTLKEYDIPEERIDELDLIIGLRFREDDYPSWYEMEISTSIMPTDEETDLIEEITFKLLDETHYSKHVFDEMTLWFNY